MNTPLRILHLEDSRRDAALIKETLQAEGLDFELVLVKNQEQFETTLAQGGFDVILCDYTLPHYNGFSALDFARYTAPGIPFILLSGSLGEDLAVESLKTGATDYILKGRLIRLVPAIRRAVQEAQDRAERKRAEEALEQIRRQHELILRCTGEGIYGLDLNGNTTFVNPSGAELLGYPVEELMGQPMHAVIHHTKRDGSPYPPEECPIYAAAKRGVPSHVEDELFWRKDGTSFSVEYVCNPIWNEPRELVGAVVTFRDVTEKKKLQAQLLHNQRLESIGQLAGGIAHDFNNILGCIVGYTELAILDATNTGAVEENLEEVLKASRRAKELVQQILTFSRQQEQERKPMRVQSVVKEALKLLRASLPSTVEICADINANAPTVLANATQVHQMIMNLATNAAHAMSGRGRLGVTLISKDVDEDFARTRPDLRTGRYVELSVSDTGCGMDRATLQRIFEPFFTTKPPGEGTGLGLSVVHGIMKSHDGAISVDSERGKGTTFRLYFPALQTAATEAIETASIPSGNGQRVLFIDDEAPLAFLGKKTLERLGYHVTARTSAPEALAAFRAEPDGYDLVITDQTMPNMTGADLAGELLKANPELPIILTTGFDGPLNSTQAQSLGIRELIMKPLTAQSLAEAAHRALTQKKGT